MPPVNPYASRLLGSTIYAPQRVVRLLVPLEVRRADNTRRFSVEWTAPRVFRPQTIRTYVDSRGVAEFDGVWVGMQNQLLGKVDAYDWSLKFYSETYAAALRALGLEGKSPEAIDRFLDDHELSLPDPGRLDLPTLAPAMILRLTGEWLRPDNSFRMSVSGATVEE